MTKEQDKKNAEAKAKAEADKAKAEPEESTADKEAAKAEADKAKSEAAKKKAADAKAKAEAEGNIVYNVKLKGQGPATFWRGGTQWERGGKNVKKSDFTKEQWERITNEQKLEVKEVPAG